MSNKTKEERITYEIVNEFLRYDPDTGKLFWRERAVKWFSNKGKGQNANFITWNKRFSGKECFNTIDSNTKILYGRILGETITTSNIIWFLHKKEWPKRLHFIDGNNQNTKIENLTNIHPKKEIKSALNTKCSYIFDEYYKTCTLKEHKEKLVTPNILKDLLIYIPETGKLFWKERSPNFFKDYGGNTQEGAAKSWNHKYAGKESFTYNNKNNGYFETTILGFHFNAHRVIWALTYGKWPNGFIDHINGIKTDNRIENLRVVTILENNKNAYKSITNTSGETNIYWNKKREKWYSKISVNDKSLHLGHFDTKDEAISARNIAYALHGFSERHGENRPNE